MRRKTVSHFRIFSSFFCCCCCIETFVGEYQRTNKRCRKYIHRTYSVCATFLAFNSIGISGTISLKQSMEIGADPILFYSIIFRIFFSKKLSMANSTRGSLVLLHFSSKQRSLTPPSVASERIMNSGMPKIETISQLICKRR